MSELLTLILGLLLGFYGRTTRDYLKNLWDFWKDKYDSHQAGIVTPQVSRVTRSQPIDLSTEAGGVTRPSPNQVALDHMKERNEKIKNQV